MALPGSRELYSAQTALSIAQALRLSCGSLGAARIKLVSALGRALTKITERVLRGTELGGLRVFVDAMYARFGSAAFRATVQYVD